MSKTYTPHTSLGLALISAGSLAFEVALTRLFAIQQFHHFAFVVVSLAVMGIAASGLLLAIQPRHPPLSTLAVAYAIFVILGYLTINYLPFDSYSIAWDRRQVWILLLYFLVSGAPFLFAGWTVGACLAEAGTEAHRPYSASLIGSALGCPAALAALSLVGGEGTVALAVALGLLAAVAFTSRQTTRFALLGMTAATFVLVVRFPSALALRLSPYKPLAITRLAPDVQSTTTLWSASTRIDVVQSDSVHVLPGLSLNAPISPPQQAALFIDGDGPIPINNLAPDDPTAKTLTSYMPAALPYLLRPGAQSLILTPGAGLDMLIALAADSEQVTVALDEPLVHDVLTGPYEEFSASILRHPRLTVISASGRSLLRQTDRNFDVIHFALSEGYRPVTSGAFSLSENYDLTVESFTDAFKHLNEDGLLLITRWLGTPPSESARIWSTLLAALDTQDLEDVRKHLIAFRGMRTATIIAARQPFSASELDLVRSFLDTKGFDPIVLPDLDPSELNRYNQLPQEVYHSLYSALLDNFEVATIEYEFNLRPPTDDRPFFFHFFRWRQTPEVLSTLGLSWQPFGGSGYFVLLALFALMLALAAPMILLPLIALRRAKVKLSAGGAATIYFACLGAGYLLVEIPLIQRLTLLLERPVIALATVLFTVLLASGLGSLLSPRIELRRALAALSALLILTNILLPRLIEIGLQWPIPVRIALCVLLLTLPGILMGVPFAAGLKRIQKQYPGSIPWAWAVNGALSGVSGVLSAWLTLDVGFSATLYVGVLTYLGAWATASRLGNKSTKANSS
ncbi:MAG: hypothetical protein GTO14_19740 [Anaerolineales bacterium]|nr:hypothetical protein [Anaerolineales bacterium]